MQQLLCDFVSFNGGNSWDGTFYQYDPVYLKVTDKQEYDLGTVNGPSTCQGTTPPAGAARDTKTAYWRVSETGFPYGGTSIFGMPSSIITYGSGTRIAETDVTYDQGSLTTVSPMQHDTNFSSGVTGRGNATTVAKQCFTPSGSCAPETATYTYDTTGQILSMTDPCGNAGCADTSGVAHITTYSYADNPSGGNPAGASNAYLTQVVYPTANGIPHQESFSYNYSTGDLASAKDENNLTTTYAYNDPLNRLTDIYQPPSAFNNNAVPHTHYAYSAAGSPPTVTATDPDGLVTISSSDGMGHIVQTEVIDSTGKPVSYLNTAYYGEGETYTVTNPYLSSPDGTTTYAYDGLGRPTIQTEQDGSKLQWCYNGVGGDGQSNCSSNKSSKTNATWIDFSDEDGNHWQRASDGLGRLVAVMEPNASDVPTLETDYQYDALDDLMQVDQWGGASGSVGDRQRLFKYDSLGRLTQAYNPETGSIQYQYSSGSNLCSGDPTNVCSRTDARQIATTYSYNDPLNRLTGKSYSDGTPAVSLAYDVTEPIPYASNFVGRMSEAITSQGGTVETNWVSAGYDEEGRSGGSATCFTASNQCNGGLYSQQFYLYDLAGNMYGYDSSFSTDPNAFGTGSSLDYLYDAAERLSTVAVAIEWDNSWVTPDIGNGWVPVLNATSFNPWGQMTGATIVANPVTQTPQLTMTRNYDNRDRIVLENDVDSNGNPLYSYTMPNPGGYDGANNLLQVSDSVMGNWSYSYDTLNRLTGGQTNTGSYATLDVSYTYDPWGNYEQEAFSGDTPASLPWPISFQFLGYSYLNGQLPANAPIPNNQMNGSNYDASGNLLDDGSNKYLYDAEGRICAVYRYWVPYSMTQYVYDGLGNRVEKGSITTFSCDQTTNGFQQTYAYLVGNDGKVREVYGDAVGDATDIDIMDRPSGGQLLSSFADNQTWNYFNDWLGTKRMEVSQAGGIYQGYASLPFGEGLTWFNYGGVDVSDKHYTGQPMDEETSNYYFGARYYNSGWGRFLTPDWSAKIEPVPYSKLENPQTLNLYAYVGNNPLIRDDPDGHAFGLDDAVGLVTGALVGVGVEIAEDLASGQSITAGGVIAAGAGGALFGEGVANAPETGGLSVIAAGAAKGAAEGAILNGVQQLTDMATGSQKSFNGTSMAVSAAAGAVSGGVMSKMPEVKVPGLSSGRANMKSVAQGVRTKIANGTASRMSLKTAIKGAVGRQAANADKTATDVVVGATAKKACGGTCQ